jgi:hypothetical protein
MTQPDNTTTRLPRHGTAFRVALLATLAVTSSLGAQIPQAIYPLTTDLNDTTAQYGPMTLTGTPPPSQPSNGVCVNGIYFYAPGGQDARTPVITTLDANDFQLDIEFQINTLPTGQGPIFVGGHLYRWIGFYVQGNGTFGVLHNNAMFTWSTATVVPGTWYSGTIKFEAGNVELFLDGVLVHQATVGALNTGNNLNFTSNNFSNGTNFNGCVREVVISNDATLGQTAITSITNYGAGCDGLALDGNGLPTVGNVGFELIATNVPATLPLGFIAFGTTAASPGIDLTPIGMAGCASYTSFDLGLFGPSPVVATSCNFPLPIPPDPTLVGAQLAAQAVAFSGATALGLATSNGTKLTIGL